MDPSTWQTDLVVGVAVTVAGAAIIGTAALVWKQVRAALANRRHRQELLGQFRVAAFNYMVNVPPSLDPDPKNPFPLVLPGTNRLLGGTWDRIMELVCKLRGSVDALYHLKGICSFSKKQRDILRGIAVCVSTFGTTLMSYGSKAGKGTARALTDDPAECVDLRHVRREMEAVKQTLTDGGNVLSKSVHRQLALRYRFLPIALRAASTPVAPQKQLEPAPTR